MDRTFTNRDVRAALRAAACQLAATIHGDPPVAEPTAEACYTGAGAFIVEFRPGDAVPVKVTSVSPAVVAENRRRSRLEAEILRVCGEARGVPLKGLVIARRIGREHDSYLRTTLARLVRDGRLKRATNGGGYLLSA